MSLSQRRPVADVDAFCQELGALVEPPTPPPEPPPSLAQPAQLSEKQQPLNQEHDADVADEKPHAPQATTDAYAGLKKRVRALEKQLVRFTEQLRQVRAELRLAGLPTVNPPPSGEDEEAAEEAPVPEEDNSVEALEARAMQMALARRGEAPYEDEEDAIDVVVDLELWPRNT